MKRLLVFCVLVVSMLCSLSRAWAFSYSKILMDDVVDEQSRVPRYVDRDTYVPAATWEYEPIIIGVNSNFVAIPLTLPNVLDLWVTQETDNTRTSQLPHQLQPMMAPNGTALTIGYGVSTSFLQIDGGQPIIQMSWPVVFSDVVPDSATYWIVPMTDMDWSLKTTFTINQMYF